jgi:GntR family transcriptional regulator
VLAGDIADGSLPPETQLPSEDGLVERFKVSRTTVRKAIQNLVERGLVEIRRGTGTFVTQPKITQELTELTGFVEDMQGLGRTPTARLLDKRIVAADEAVAHQLALAPGTLVASACSLGRRCGDVVRRDILASRDRGEGCGERP